MWNILLESKRARLAAAVCAFFPLLACTTVERIQESAQSPRAAGELAQAAAAAGMAHKFLLPVSPDLILLGLAYVIYDPLAPNWEIETSRVSENVFRMQFIMKRFHTGGEGEALYVFRRNARRIAQAAGYDDYQVLRYEEGIESSTLASRRFGEGEIRLVRGQ